MLYPIVLNPQPNIIGGYVIAPSTMHCFEFVIAEGQFASIAVLHTGQPVDFTLECSITSKPGNGAVIYSPEVMSNWHASRSFTKVMKYHDPAIAPPQGRYVTQLIPGRYYLNVLNMANSANLYEINMGVFDAV